MCFLEVYLPRPQQVGETVAAALGTVVAVIVIATLAYWLVVWGRNRGREEDAPAEEDATPPRPHGPIGHLVYVSQRAAM